MVRHFPFGLAIQNAMTFVFGHTPLWFAIAVFTVLDTATMMSPAWRAPDLIVDLELWPFDLSLLGLTCVAGLLLGVVAVRTKAVISTFFFALALGLSIGWFSFIISYSYDPDQRIGEAGMYGAFLMYMAHVSAIQLSIVVGFLAGKLASHHKVI